MKKIILFLMFMVLMSSLSYAAADSIQINTSGLTDEQKAKIASLIGDMKKEESSPSTPKKVDEWVNVGAHIGDALITAASKLGVAGDQFMKSDTGKMVAVIIVWKMMGGALVHIILGVMWTTLFLIGWIYFFRKMCVVQSITYTPIEGSSRRKKEIKYYNNADVSSDMGGLRAMFWFSLIIGIAVGIFTIFTF